VHQEVSQPVAASSVAASSASQSPMVKLLETTRVPGLSPRMRGLNFRLISGSRNIVITVARERSAPNRSALTNCARSATPASRALRCDSSTMSGSYSMPRARTPRRAAVMTVRPSPEPRSIT
jgi:hypothetical protein